MHQSALSSPVIAQRHATFIAKRLAISSGVLAVVPFFLAFRGAPTAAETLVFACSFTPLAAAVFVARTGRLAAAHGIAFLGLVGLSLSLWLGLGCGAGCAIAWLVTAQIEATLACEKRLTRSAGVLTGMVAVGLLFTPLHGEAALSRAAALPGACAALALAYAITVVAGFWSHVEPSVGNKKHESKKETQIWRAFSEMLDDLVIGFNASGSVVRVPTDCESRLGLPAHTLMGSGLFEHVHVADRPAFLTLIADAAYSDSTTTAKIRLRTWGHRPGDAAVTVIKHMWIEIRAKRIAPDDGADGAPRQTRADICVIAVLRDIDAEHTIKADVPTRSGSSDVLHSNDHFLANMSHELRTPLNAIIGFSEMLSSRTLRPADAEKQRDYARIVHQSGQHLLSVVDAMLDMSKIRSGTLTLAPEPFEIGPLIDLCCDMVALKAEEGRVDIVCDYASGLEQIVGDRRACKQILINLLSNAVKFTPAHGRVAVSAWSEEHALVISVNDTGVGIGASDLGRLGEPFFQAHAASNPRFEGTGLGLSVVRGLVGLHGGTIALESEPGRGTHIKVRLPLDGRIIGRKSTPALIETIARRQAPDLALGSPDRRMKKIA